MGRSAALPPAPSSTAVPQAIVTRSIRIRKLAVLVLVLLGAFAGPLIASAWPYASGARQGIVMAGQFLILVCIVGRTWCSLYLGGRKLQVLVDTGPYSLVRNPLYVFSTIGAIGVGIVFGLLTLSVVLGALVALIFALSVRTEEAMLERIHGQAFRAYCARVPRFWPRFANWRDAAMLEAPPRIVYRSFLDSALFLAAIPLAFAVAALQAAGWVHPVLTLP